MDRAHLPVRLLSLPCDEDTGHPIPSATLRKGSVVVFGTTGLMRVLLLAATDTCSICGQPLLRQCFKLGDGGPSISHESPAHLSCLLFATTVCPHLSNSSGSLRINGYDHALVSVRPGVEPSLSFHYRELRTQLAVPEDVDERAVILARVVDVEHDVGFAGLGVIDESIATLLNHAGDAEATISALAVLLGAAFMPGYGLLLDDRAIVTGHRRIGVAFARQPGSFTGQAAELGTRILDRGPYHYSVNLRIWRANLLRSF